MGYRWEGYRRKWRSVWPDVRRTLEEEGGLAPLLDRLGRDPALQRRLRARLAVSVSRLFRSRRSFETLMRLLAEFLPERGEVRAWSAGCACGEEVSTLAIFWRESIAPARPELRLRILGTDVREECLERARLGVYPPSAARNVPPTLRERYFDPTAGGLRFRAPPGVAATFALADLLEDPPPQGCTIALCRNLAFTYFGPAGQTAACRALAAAVAPGGFLLIGDREALPEQPWFAPIAGERTILRRLQEGGTGSAPRGAGGGQPPGRGALPHDPGGRGRARQPPLDLRLILIADGLHNLIGGLAACAASLAVDVTFLVPFASRTFRGPGRRWRSGATRDISPDGWRSSDAGQSAWTSPPPC